MAALVACMAATAAAAEPMRSIPRPTSISITTDARRLVLEVVINDFPTGVLAEFVQESDHGLTAMPDELAAAGLTALPATHVRPPLIKGSPVSLECVSQATIVTGPRQLVVIGRVLGAHVDDAYVQDAERGYMDTPAMGLIARMHGGGWYARSTDLFQLARPTAPL